MTCLGWIGGGGGEALVVSHPMGIYTYYPSSLSNRRDNSVFSVAVASAPPITQAVICCIQGHQLRGAGGHHNNLKASIVSFLNASYGSSKKYVQGFACQHARQAVKNHVLVWGLN
jgi:hypothetical protein